MVGVFRARHAFVRCLPTSNLDSSDLSLAARSQCTRATNQDQVPFVWLNGTCLTATMTPNHVQVGESYANQFLQVSIPALSAAQGGGNKKRSLSANLQLLVCAFDVAGNLTTNVTELTADTAKCPLPFSASPFSSVSRVLYAGRDLTVPQSFSFIGSSRTLLASIFLTRCGRLLS